MKYCNVCNWLVCWTIFMSWSLYIQDNHTNCITREQHLMCSFHRFHSCFSQIIFLSEKKKTKTNPPVFFSPQSIIAVLMTNLSARIIAVFPRGGFVMELMIVGITKMNQIKLVQVKILLGCANKFFNFSSMNSSGLIWTELNQAPTCNLIIDVLNEFQFWCN